MFHCILDEENYKIIQFERNVCSLPKFFFKGRNIGICKNESIHFNVCSGLRLAIVDSTES